MLDFLDSIAINDHRSSWEHKLNNSTTYGIDSDKKKKQLAEKKYFLKRCLMLAVACECSNNDVQIQALEIILRGGIGICSRNKAQVP